MKEVVDIDYISISEFAARAGLSVQIVNRYCKQKKYQGAYQDKSRRWHIPVKCLPTEVVHDRGNGRPPVKDVRRNRSIAVNDAEWKEITERAALTAYSVNEYIIRKALDLQIITNEEAVQRAMASLKITGYEFDEESEDVWGKLAKGKITTEEARKLLFEKIEKLRVERPECFAKPDVDD